VKVITAPAKKCKTLSAPNNSSNYLANLGTPSDREIERKTKPKKIMIRVKSNNSCR
jgi:hypothetical protein